MLDKMKALWDMQKKMQELKRELDGTTFEIESQDKSVKIVMNGSQEIKDVRIQANDAGNLEAAVKDICNRAIKRSHDIAAEKMKSVTGLNLPGLM
jgi:nucleoid-associated protein EbfC